MVADCSEEHTSDTRNAVRNGKDRAVRSVLRDRSNCFCPLQCFMGKQDEKDAAEKVETNSWWYWITAWFRSDEEKLLDAVKSGDATEICQIIERLKEARSHLNTQDGVSNPKHITLDSHL